MRPANDPWFIHRPIDVLALFVRLVREIWQPDDSNASSHNLFPLSDAECTLNDVLFTLHRLNNETLAVHEQFLCAPDGVPERSTFDFSMDVLGSPTEFQSAIGDTPKRTNCEAAAARAHRQESRAGKAQEHCRVRGNWRLCPKPQAQRQLGMQTIWGAVQYQVQDCAADVQKLHRHTPRREWHVRALR